MKKYFKKKEVVSTSSRSFAILSGFHCRDSLGDMTEIFETYVDFIIEDVKIFKIDQTSFRFCITYEEL